MFLYGTGVSVICGFPGGMAAADGKKGGECQLCAVVVIGAVYCSGQQVRSLGGPERRVALSVYVYMAPVCCCK